MACNCHLQRQTASELLGDEFGQQALVVGGSSSPRGGQGEGNRQSTPLVRIGGEEVVAGNAIPVLGMHISEKLVLEQGVLAQWH